MFKIKWRIIKVVNSGGTFYQLQTKKWYSLFWSTELDGTGELLQNSSQAVVRQWVYDIYGMKYEVVEEGKL